MAGAAESAARPARRIVFLGAPGCGKGTQAVVVAEALGIPAISTGEMLRSAVAEGSELGRRVESVMAAGLLVDDTLMAEVVRGRLARPDAAAGFILDGYPRTVGQAATLDEILAAGQVELDAVVMMEVPAEELVRRALGRGRGDDKDEVIRERLRVYEEKTAPLVGLYRQRQLLAEIDGFRSIEQVTKSILEVLHAA